MSTVTVRPGSCGFENVYVDEELVAVLGHPSPRVWHLHDLSNLWARPTIYRTRKAAVAAVTPR